MVNEVVRCTWKKALSPTRQEADMALVYPASASSVPTAALRWLDAIGSAKMSRYGAATLGRYYGVPAGLRRQKRAITKAYYPQVKPTRLYGLAL